MANRRWQNITQTDTTDEGSCLKTQPHILMILENGSFPEDTRVRQEAVALVEAGFNVTVVCPTGELSSKHDVVNGVRVYRYPKPVEIPGVFGYAVEFGYSLLIAFVYSWFVFIRHGFDALHVHCPPDMNSLLGIFWKLAGKRFVVDLHDLSPELYDARSKGEGGAVLKRILLFFERLACRAGTRLIATNQTQQEVQINPGGASREHAT